MELSIVPLSGIGSGDIDNYALNSNARSTLCMRFIRSSATVYSYIDHIKYSTCDGFDQKGFVNKAGL